jgi:TPR repeat protein
MSNPILGRPPPDCGMEHHRCVAGDKAIRSDLERAEGGDLDAMVDVAKRLWDSGEQGGADLWARRAAAAGSTPGMRMVGLIADTRGSSSEAEAWFRRAAEAGDSWSMANLASLLLGRDELDEAEGWLTQALGQDDIPEAMGNMAFICQARGDLTQAEVWSRRAAEIGHPSSMNRLGRLLRERGEMGEAETWYRRGAEAGDVGCMAGLGFVLMQLDRSAEAEPWLRAAAEAGKDDAKVNLGIVLTNRGELDQAEAWYRSASSSNPRAAAGLNRIRTKRRSDFKLELIRFETFGWAMDGNEEAFRRWRGDGVTLMESYVDMPPDFSSWDADTVREEILDSIEQLGSLDEMDLPDSLPPAFRQAILEANALQLTGLLDLDLFELSPPQRSARRWKIGPRSPVPSDPGRVARCVSTTMRIRYEESVHYVAGIIVLFDRCFWSLQIDSRGSSGIEKAPSLAA